MKGEKMSKAYQCDRCGCYFDDKNKEYFGAIKINADFCPECVRSFEKWLKMNNTESEEVQPKQTDNTCEDKKRTDEEIDLGDEVVGDFGEKGVVVGIDTCNNVDYLSLLMRNHKVPQIVTASRYKTKTGKHFPQIIELLEQMKGEADETYSNE